MTTLGLLNNQDSWLGSEIDVLSDLIEENIQATGVDLRYMPREQVNLDEIFGEATMSNIKEGFVIEMYLDNISNFNGDGDMFSKFNMFHTDDATLIVSSRRFAVEGKSHGLVNPIEGDLIYMPFSNTMWNIKKVKRDKEYFQFGENRVWRLEVSLHNPTHETFVGGTVAPSDLGQSVKELDESGLNNLMGIADFLTEDQGSVFNTKSTQENVPTEFNSDNPFGD